MMHVLASDHKPVYAKFELTARLIDKTLLEEKKTEINRELDKMENESTPDLTPSTHSLQFGACVIGVPVTRSFILENNGKVYTEFSFKPPSKSWIELSGLAGSLVPGERVLVSATVNLSSSDAQKLNAGVDALDDILILSINNGRDIFIDVFGTWHKSVFGATIESLCLTQTVPTVVWRIVDWLYKHGLNTLPADPTVAAYLRWCLDTDSDFSDDLLDDSLSSFPEKTLDLQLLCKTAPVDTTALPVPQVPLGKGKQVVVASMTRTLLFLLDSFVDGVVPANLVQKCVDAGYHSIVAARQCLELIPQHHRDLFMYIALFLKESVGAGPREGVVALFAPVLMRAKESVKGGLRDYGGDVFVRKRKMFLMQFLEN